MAVAFVSRSGLSLIDSSMNYICSKKANLEFLIGLDMRTTEPEALKYIHNLSKIYNNITLYCYSSLEQSSIYHPKLYIFKGAKTITSIIGSSNLTAGGLKKNIEVNIVVTIDEQDEMLSDIYATYNRLKFHPKRVIPDDEFIEYYASLCKLEKKCRLNFTRNNLAKELLINFEAKAKSLQRPRPTNNDLVGWTKLVFDQLPVGEFTTTQTYIYENEFANLYPENRNIKAKIRQQLQVLRDIGLIEHIGKSKWRKFNQNSKNKDIN
jgi:HKD family nuclease